ncbi:MAG: NAD-dependent 4,6-dehydratase LegB [Candidatus Rifleibacteriota bacterium]
MTNRQQFSVKNSSIAITGAGGFIGSHLTESLLLAGAKVKALFRYNSRASAGWLDKFDHPNLIKVFGDIKDRSMMESFLRGTECVFHLAALIGIPYSYEAPQSYIDTNVYGTLNILEAAAHNKLQRVILTSTSEVYGSALHIPMGEDHPLQGQSPYSASKISADMLGVSFARSFKHPVVIVRPFNTFGPRQSLRAVIPTIILQALTSDKIRLGNLAPIRDFNFVEDTVNGFIAAAEYGLADARPYNLATGKGISIHETVKKVIKLTGSNAEIEEQIVRKRPDGSEVEKLIGNADRAFKELGWQPQTGFDEGLAKTIAWIRENLSEFSKINSYIR